jgi:phosphonate transport system substrate-binding protein
MTRPTHCTCAALVTMIALLLTMSGCGSSAAPPRVEDNDHDPHVLVFAATPAFGSPIEQQFFKAVIEMLEKDTGKQIIFQTGTDFAAIIDGLRDGRKFAITALGPLSYVIARDRGAPITLAAVRVNEKGGPPGYQSYGITWTGSPIKTLADFRGKRICFVDHNSTSGYLYPSAGLLDIGIDPSKDIIPIFAGHHDASVLAVANHQCDAGFVFDTGVDQLIKQGQLQPGQVTPVWKSGTIPSPTLVIANYLSPTLRQQLITALQKKANADYLRANGFCQGECKVAERASYGYQPGNDADYNGLSDICRKVQKAPCTEG